MNKGVRRSLEVLAAGAFLLIGTLGVYALGTPELGFGDVLTREYDNENYDGLVISGIDDFEILMSNRYSVSITADESILEEIEVSQYGSDLSLILPDAYKYIPSVLKARIEIPRLKNLEVEAKSHGFLTGIPLPDYIKISVTDGSDLDLEYLYTDLADIELSVNSRLSGTIDAEDLTLRVYSSGLDLRGRAGTLHCFSSAGDISIESFVIDSAVLDFHNETSAVCELLEAEGIRWPAETTVKLYDESELILSAEGEVRDYVEDDSELTEL